MSNVYKCLEERGLINQITHQELVARLDEKPITLYCGFDPTGDSLHVGHLLIIFVMKHFEQYHHQNIALVGGATGLIGDPSGKKDERILNTKNTVIEYSKKIKKQLSNYLDSDKTIIANNYDWISQLSVIDFLRDFGKDFGINYMINKESVSSRLNTGLSYTEFSYTILQAIDFEHLYNVHNCELQIGGSDQWGNITSGLEIIRKKNPKAQAFGITIPLVTKNDGTKFGKTEDKTIWLDKEKTSPYEFYQFFLNTEDQDVIKYLYYFTFLSVDEIESLKQEILKNPHLRIAQRTLAYEVTKFVHSKKDADIAINISKALFDGDITNLTSDEITNNFIHIKSFKIKNATRILDCLVDVQIAKSKREAREFISNNSISINGDKKINEQWIVKKKEAIGEKYLLIKRGKKKYVLVEVINE